MLKLHLFSERRNIISNLIAQKTQICLGYFKIETYVFHFILSKDTPRVECLKVTPG